MIEYVLVFLAGLVYGVVGTGVARKVREPLNVALMAYGIPSGSLWAVYASLMVVLLWPVLGFLFVLTTGYATLSGVSE